jgi:large subunit ribosomal protein L2
MGIKKFKPITSTLLPHRRRISPELTTSKPEKSMLESFGRTGGRNNMGRMTNKRTGGHEALSRRRLQAPEARCAGEVASIEYDPYRTSRVALIHYADGEKSASSRPTI